MDVSCLSVYDDAEHKPDFCCATRARLVLLSARGESFDTMRARKQQSTTSA